MIFFVGLLFSDWIGVFYFDYTASWSYLLCPTGGGTSAGEGQKAQDGASVRHSAGAKGGGGRASGDSGQLEPTGPTGAAQHQ